jgi:hypothetical protein
MGKFSNLFSFGFRSASLFSIHTHYLDSGEDKREKKWERGKVERVTLARVVFSNLSELMSEVLVLVMNITKSIHPSTIFIQPIHARS